MTSFFGVGGNPFATIVGQKIEQATDGSLASENWTLNIEICDLINETEDGPKDAIKAIRKRLQQSIGKNYTIVMFTLTVLETCVKNCGKRFHILVCNKEFISELVKIIGVNNNTVLNVFEGPKNEPPTVVQEKVLSLIQSWADAFRNHPDLSGVVQVYNELKAKGIEFPMTDLDAMAPIHTPRKSVKDSLDGSNTVAVAPVGGGGDSGPVSLTGDQIAKLRSDLDILQTNMTVFGEMLNEMTPGNEHPSDLELFQELNTTLRLMQERLVELISKLSNDEMTADLLRINDHLNNLFLRYSRYEKNREASKEGHTSREQNGQESLIDLNEEASGPLPEVTSQMSNLGLGGQLANLNTVSAQSGSHKADKEDEFDTFAQSRKLESSKDSGSSYESNRKPDQISGSLAAAAEARAAQGTPSEVLMMHKESDFDEMAAWLEGAGEKSVLTSSEFERFLAERAMAAEKIPPPDQRNAGGNTSSRDADFDKFLSERAAAAERLPSASNRQKGKDPQDSSLFSL
nr:TOM1-like protein 2 isoform X3 [Halyomorpha halys]